MFPNSEYVFSLRMYFPLKYLFADPSILLFSLLFYKNNLPQGSLSFHYYFALKVYFHYRNYFNSECHVLFFLNDLSSSKYFPCGRVTSVLPMYSIFTIHIFTLQTLSLSLSVSPLHSLFPSSKDGISAMYHFRLALNLGIGNIAIRRIICACNGCLEQLDSVWKTGTVDKEQRRWFDDLDD